ncbi:MAG: DNRLRE domain-containing protein [Syntrophomonadaceae bacterium]|nr:DNRLRE domain-containing protein [Syntrophomonadaceae bacterium]
MADVTLNTVREAYISQYYPNQNFGSPPRLFAGSFKQTCGDIYRSLLEFDMRGRKGWNTSGCGCRHKYRHEERHWRHDHDDDCGCGGHGWRHDHDDDCGCGGHGWRHGHDDDCDCDEHDKGKGSGNLCAKCIDTAVLKLTLRRNEIPVNDCITLKVYMINSRWDDDRVNWKNQPSVFRRCIGSESINSGLGTVNIDITRAVENWCASGGRSPFSIMIEGEEDCLRLVGFASSCDATASARPAIDITYNDSEDCGCAKNFDCDCDCD